MGPQEPARAPASAPGRGEAPLAALTARILALGRARLGERSEYANIASPVGVAQYVGIAGEMAVALGRGHVLDWGAGWGQTSLLLRAHGLTVTAYDIDDKGAAAGLLAGSDIVYVVDPGPRLPFHDAAFDGALNCGVLEHVDDPPAALAELRRVLRPDGRLFTYHLPNRQAWAEWVGRRLGRFHHDRTFTRAEAITLFEAAGFSVLVCRPFHWLPRNVWAQWPGLPMPPGMFETADAALVHLPGLRRLATAWALVARRPA